LRFENIKIQKKKKTNFLLLGICEKVHLQNFFNMLYTFRLVILLFLIVENVSGSDLSNTVFIIMSQPNRHHVKVAEDTEAILIDDLKKEGIESQRVLLLHRDLNIIGNWAVVPLLPTLSKIGGIYGQARWFAFLPEAAKINTDILKSVLKKYSPKR
jgi:hypothetical protein